MSTAKASKRIACIRGIACLLALGGSVSCASTGIESGVYTHPEIGYSIPEPDRVADEASPAWRRTRVEGTDIAYRAPDESYLAVSSHCDEKEVRPGVLARQLLVGLKNRELTMRKEFEFAGGRAFAQRVESTDEAGRVIHTRTITLVRGGCVVDWVLVTRNLDTSVAGSFESWWQAFDPGEMPAADLETAEVTQ